MAVILTTKTGITSRVILFLLFVVIPSISDAWLYSEHQEITTTAHLKACTSFFNKFDVNRLSKTQRIKLDEFCRPITALCHGHMSAIAADIVGKPDGFFREYNKDLLKTETLNCLSSVEYFSAKSPDDIRKKPRDDLKLGDGVDLHKKLLLVATNDSHFNPTAADDWRKYLNNAVNSIEAGQMLEVVLSNNAFALHYLEDAFSAGHSGIDRTKRLQNDHLAFHDHYNLTGIFFKSKQKKMVYLWGWILG